MSSVALHHVLDGPADGAPIVLSASLGTTHALWEPQLPELAARHRVIRYDHRGHGGSPAPPGDYSLADLGMDVLALLDHLEIATTAWCGASLGGMVGLWLAINAPERLNSLVVICSSAHAPPPSRWLERAAAVRAAGSTAVVADAVLAGWFTAEFARSDPQAVERAGSMLRSTLAGGYAGCCAAIASLDLRDALARIELPTLVASAAQDTALPREHGLAIAAGVRGARFTLIERAAHIANIEQPALVSRLILDHLDGPADG